MVHCVVSSMFGVCTQGQKIARIGNEMTYITRHSHETFYSVIL